MALKNLLKEKQDLSEKVLRMTPSELESLRKDMKKSGEWMQQELKKGKLEREGRGELNGTGGLLESAQGLEREQRSLLDEGQIRDAYQNTLDTYVLAKHEQVEIIESRLKNIINQQQVRFQQLQRNTPGFLSLPKARRLWQSQKAQQQVRLHTLQNRLSAVVEIKEGMGLHSPRIEELAAHKMRTQNPELTSKMDDLNMGARQHDIALRMKQKKAQNLGHVQGKGRSLTKSKSGLN